LAEEERREIKTILEERGLAAAEGALAEALGAYVSWDENKRAVEIYLRNIAPPGSKLTLNDYLLIWDNTYSELGKIQNVARNLSISVTQGPVDNIKASETMFLLSSQAGRLFEQLSCLSPPTEAVALHRETLKELVLWSTGYRLSAKGLANLRQGEFYSVKPFADEAYEQSSVVWGLRKAITK